eukprot:7360625-Prorocentrum_lima.AAC.1
MGRQQHQHNTSECCEMRVGWRSAVDTSEVDGVVVDIWRLDHVETNTYMSEMHADCAMPRKIRKAA